MALENVIQQEMVDLKGPFGLALLVTRCVATSGTVTITVPALANTGTGTQPGSKGTQRASAVSAAVFLDHGEVQSEVEGQVSGTSTAPTVTVAAANSNRETTVTIVSGSGTALKRGDTFTLVTLHRQEDLSFTQEKFQ